MRASVLAFALLFAVAANAQVLSTEVVDLNEVVADETAGLVQSVEKPSGFGAAIVPADTVVDHTLVIPEAHEIVQTATINLAGRKMLSSRKMLGVDGDGPAVTINNATGVYSRFGYRHCPTTNLPWADVANYTDTEYTRYGDLIHDAGICLTTGNGVGKVATTQNAVGVVYGGVVQDFGTARPNWESYGWSLFKLADPPAGTNRANVIVQGLSLHLIGNVGASFTGTATNCSVKAVSVAIYNANQATFEPTTVNYTKRIDIGAGENTFIWNSNSSGVLYVDIAPAPDQFHILENSTYYWLRVKVFADYGGASGTGQCFVFWGVQSAIQNDQGRKSRWQERIGGASGYSTTCVGAADSGAAPGGAGNIPGLHQTWWNCWNNGMRTSSGNTGRRCLTYRATVNPAIPQQDCLSTTDRARFNDYNYAFSGMQGQPGFSDSGPGAGAGGGGP